MDLWVIGIWGGGGKYDRDEISISLRFRYSQYYLIDGIDLEVISSAQFISTLFFAGIILPSFPLSSCSSGSICNGAKAPCLRIWGVNTPVSLGVNLFKFILGTASD